jgi:hypothetical protein
MAKGVGDAADAPTMLFVDGGDHRRPGDDGLLRLR